MLNTWKFNLKNINSLLRMNFIIYDKLLPAQTNSKEQIFFLALAEKEKKD